MQPLKPREDNIQFNNITMSQIKDNTCLITIISIYYPALVPSYLILSENTNEDIFYSLINSKFDRALVSKSQEWYSCCR